jgi:hypothetical protein
MSTAVLQRHSPATDITAGNILFRQSRCPADERALPQSATQMKSLPRIDTVQPS